MPCEYFWSSSQVVKHFSGKVTGREFLHSIRTVSSSEKFDSLTGVINNFSDVSEFSIDQSTLLDATGLTVGVAITNPRLKVAFVVPEGVVGNTIRTVLAPAAVPSYRHEVFTSFKEAQQWVGLS